MILLSLISLPSHMASRRIINYKLIVLANISIFWVAFAFLFLYNIILIDKNDVTGRSLIIFSLAFATIGFVVSAILIFYLRTAFRFFPLWVSVLLKMILIFFLFVLIAFVMLSMYYVFAEKRTFESFLGAFYRDVFLTKAFMIFMFDLAVMALLTIIILEVIDKYGPGGFWGMMRGSVKRVPAEYKIFFYDANITDSYVTGMNTCFECRRHAIFFHIVIMFSLKDINGLSYKS